MPGLLRDDVPIARNSFIQNGEIDSTVLHASNLWRASVDMQPECGPSERE
jgi:hypothetical protein